MVTRAMTKNQIRDEFLRVADLLKIDLSRSRANNLADRYKKGKSIDLLTTPNPEWKRIINYSDPTGEMACGFIRNPYKEQAA